MKTLENDLTKGSVSKQLIRYATPLILSSMLQAVYSIVDVMIAGHFVGGRAISAINNASLVTNLLTQLIIGFTVGGNVLIGQYFGSRDTENRKLASGTLFTMCIVAGLVLGALVFAFSRQIMSALGAPSLEEASTYLATCAAGMLFIAGYNALSATLRGIGNSKMPLIFVGVATMTNVALDLLFVGAFKLEVFGAALATVISQFIAFLLAVIFVLKRQQELGFTRHYLRVRKQMVKGIAKLGFPVSLQSAVACISWLVVMVLINKHGVDISAGNGVSNKIKDFCQLFITATTGAAATMAAQNLGIGEYERARSVMKVCIRMTLAIALGTIIIVQLAAPVLVRLFTNEDAVIKAAVQNLRIEILAQVFYASFLSFNILAIAAGDTMFVMWNSFLNCIVVRLVLAIIFEHFFGIVGVYVACALAPGSSVPVGFIYYRSGKWQKRLAK